MIALLPSCTTLRTGHDVVPEGWLVYNGSDQSQSTDAGAMAYVFPSYPAPSGIGAAPVSFSIIDFLSADNRIPNEVVFSLRRKRSQGAETKEKIVLQRLGNGQEDLKILLDEQTMERIGSLDWGEFQTLQERFSDWLLNQAHTGMHQNSYKRFQGGRARYQDEIRRLWITVLTGAEVASHFPKQAGQTWWAPDEKRAISNGGKTNHGPAMGAIPLEPGMRLTIKWGGTALYHANNVPMVTRQTVTGHTVVDLLNRGGKVTLGLPAYLLRDDSSPQGWGIKPIPVANPSVEAKLAPFGEKKDDLAHFVAVFNEFDLAQLGALADARNAVAQHLTLLVPYQYTKSDTSSSVPNSETSDARHLQSASVVSTLAHRFIIWGSKNRYRGPRDAPVLALTDEGEWPTWPYRPLVFANQSSVSVEVPLYVNKEPVRFMPLGVTLADAIEGHPDWFGRKIGRDRGQGFAALTRTSSESGVYRFYEKTALRRVLAMPNDQIQFQLKE
ncbi:hypothetical protein [Prosthecobacter dejongeii]|nr:hypothetical protein [Prosthecobacter dejongeii]